MRRMLYYVIFAIGLLGCGEDIPDDIDLREEMRGFVIEISEYVKAFDATFLVIPQNGIELVSSNGESDGPLHTAYLCSFLDKSMAERNTILGISLQNRITGTTGRMNGIRIRHRGWQVKIPTGREIIRFGIGKRSGRPSFMEAMNHIWEKF